MEIRDVAVIGFGTMGAAIAEVFARSGVGVTAIEVGREALAAGMASLDGSLGRAVRRGQFDTEGKRAILDRVTPSTDLADAAHAGLVIEAVPEQMDLKRRVFAELDQVCRPGAILATNTSSLSVTEIAVGTSRPGRVLGLHFFNPAPVMHLVEVVTTVLTDSWVVDAAARQMRGLGKTPVTVGDRAGFLVNALLLPYLNHAVRLLESGYASPEDIDEAAKSGIGLPMGPLTLLDLMGLDSALSVLEVLYAEFGGQRRMPAPLLRRLVTAGMTGRKSGRGLYPYGPAEPRVKDSTPLPHGSGEQAPPHTVALIMHDDQAGKPAAALSAALTEAGIAMTGPTATESDLVVVAAAPDRPRVRVDAIAGGRPADTVGLHLSGERVAEIVRTTLSSPAALARADALARHLGRVPLYSPDRPGFLVAALLFPHLNDAVRMLGEGYASATDIDAAMTLGCRYPRGPLQMIDHIGPDVVLAGLAAIYECWRDPAFGPDPLLAEQAAAGLPFHPADQSYA